MDSKRSWNLAPAALLVAVVAVLGAACDDGTSATAECIPSCGAGTHCEEGACVPNQAQQDVCDPACPEDKKCQDGICVLRDVVTTLECPALLTCIGACAAGDDSCTGACRARGSEYALYALNALERCLTDAGCDGSECAQEHCPAQLSACLDGSCGDVSAAGVCEGTTLLYCDGGFLRQLQCLSLGPECVCAYNPPAQIYDCSCGTGPCNPACPPGYGCKDGQCVYIDQCNPPCPDGYTCIEDECRKF